jgi:type I restriction enzyme S subunit
VRHTRLSDVCDIEMGQAPIGSSYNHTGEGYPLLAGAGDFGAEFPQATKYTTQPTKISQPGDILLCIRATVGDLNWSDKSYCLGRGIAGLRPRNEKLDRKYLWRCMEHLRADLENSGRGSTFLQVSRRDIADLLIPLPSDMGEQRRIATILDKADGIRGKRRQGLVLMDELLMSVFLESFGDPVANTKKWPMQSLGSVCSKITDGTHDTPPRQSSGVMFITGKNIRPFRIDRENLEFVSEDVHREIYRRCNPEFGDVLYTNIGAGTGNAAYNEFEFEFSMKNVALLKPNPDRVDGRYLEFVLNNDKFKQRLIARYGQGGAQGFLGLKTIKSVEVPLPPIALQTRFNEIVSRARTASTRVKLAYESDEGLFLSLSQRAFRGEL